MSNTPSERRSTPDPPFNLPDANQAFDSALCLIASPLLPAARAAAAQHPFHAEDLHDDIGLCFNSDIPSTDFDDFLLDTQYVQLESLKKTSPAPTTTTPQPSQPPPPSYTTKRPPPAPPPPPPPPHLKQKDVTPLLHLSPKFTRRSSPKTSPIPIAPRAKQQKEQPQQNPRLQQQQQPPSKRKPQQFESRGAARLAERRSSTDASPAQPVPAGPATVPFPPHMAQGMIPLMNMTGMYQLQHHVPVFPVARKDSPASAPGASDSKKMRVEPSATMPLPQFLSPGVPLVSPGVFHYDPGMVPLFQMTPQMYAQMAAAAAYQGQPSHSVSSVPQNQQNIQDGVLHSIPMVPPFSEANKTATAATGADAGVKDVDTPAVSATAVPPSPGASLVLHPNRSMVGREIGSKIPVPQQPLAGLKKHPVLGRLQLQNGANRMMVKMAERGKSSVRMTDTQTVDGGSNDDLGGLGGTGRPSAVGGGARAGPSSQGGSSGFQDGEQPRPQKKRLVWTPELHERFVKAIEAVGLGQAVPKTLVTIMNVEGLTTEHVKSHLQKYRNSLRKEAVEEQRERSRNTGVEGASEAGAIQPVGGVDANRSGSVAGVTTNESGERQYAVLPNRISVYGTPVGTGAGVENGRMAEDAGSGVVGKELGVNEAGMNLNSKAQSGQRGVVSGRRDESEIQISHVINMKGECERNRNEGGVGSGVMHAGMAAQLVGRGVDGVGSMNLEMMEGVDEILGNVGGEIGSMAGGRGSSEGGQTEEDRTEDIGKVSQAWIDSDGGGQEGREGTDDVVTAAEIEGGRSGDNGADMKMDGRGGGVLSKSWSEGPRSKRIGKEARLELMNAKTLQMQLTLQIMVHRTITLEKRLEQESTDKMQAEASAAVSGRSGRSDHGGSRDNRSGSIGNRNELNGCSNSRGGMVGTRQGGDGEMSSKCTVAAILKEQMEMTKALEQTRDIINEEMKDYTMELENERTQRGEGDEEDENESLEARNDE